MLWDLCRNLSDQSAMLHIARSKPVILFQMNSAIIGGTVESDFMKKIWIGPKLTISKDPGIWMNVSSDMQGLLYYQVLGLSDFST